MDGFARYKKIDQSVIMDSEMSVFKNNLLDDIHITNLLFFEGFSLQFQ